jgi:hypothetical protein
MPPFAPLPTVTRNAAVLLQGEQVGPVPKPLAIVGFVELIIRLPASSLNDVEERVPPIVIPAALPDKILFSGVPATPCPAQN